MVWRPASARSRAARTRPRPVVLSSPYPVDECLQRLAQVTTKRRPTSWYLDTRTALLPSPRFWGDVSPSGISIVQFEDASGKVSYSPQLCIWPEPAAEGGTTLTGTIGMEQGSKDGMQIGTGCMGLICLGFIAGGIVTLVRGDITGIVLLLAPLFAIGFAAAFSSDGLRSLEKNIPELIGDVNKTLGSTATFPDRSAGVPH
jgi:hypothetical protein